MNKINKTVLLICLFVVSSAVTVPAFQDDKPEIPADIVEKIAEAVKKDDDPKKEKPKFKKYEDVITKKAITKKGIFTTHEVDDKLYYEFDPQQFGKEFLWLVQVAKVETNKGLGGLEASRLIVRFERLGDDILLRSVEHDIRARAGSTEELAVQSSSIDGIIAALKIETFGPNNAPVVDMTSIFKGDISEFSPKDSLNAAALDKTRVFITSVKTFEKNIETRVLATYKLKPARGALPGQPASDPGTATAELNHSMVALPEKPMRPRYYDRRVGFFNGSYLDFSSDRNIAERVSLIRRWRLEKKDPSAAMSEPIKPIVYYVGREVPKKYQQATIEGIEMWQSAFEKAGFKKAIIGKLAPTVEEDPNWDAEDARYSTVRWLASETRNAFGPHVQDPRSGEILESDVRMFHNVVALLEDWYFIQAGASDPRASKLPLSEDVMQELVRYVVAHEVGHTLGLQHNMLGNNAYPVESYRDPKFVKEFGMSSSIMDYARFNYIAQPEDKAVYIPSRVGPYDHFAIEWGYKQFDDSKPVSADFAPLNKIADLQLGDARLRFGSGAGGDPRAQTEDIGDDAIKATTYGLRNLERISGMLVNATAEKGKDFSHLSAMYGTLLGQMNRELGHVAAYVGGIERDNLVSGLPRSDTFRPTPVAKQKEALAYIVEHGLQTKPFLLNREIIQRIGIDSVVSQIGGAQSALMRRILSNSVVDRNSSLEAGGYQVYSSVEIFDDMRTGIFPEVYGQEKAPDVFRRNLQRATVDHLISVIDRNDNASNVPAALRALGVQNRTSADYRALSRNMLVKLKADLSRASTSTTDGMTKIHYNDLAAVITQALEGK